MEEDVGNCFENELLMVIMNT